MLPGLARILIETYYDQGGVLLCRFTFLVKEVWPIAMHTGAEFTVDLEARMVSSAVLNILFVSVENFHLAQIKEYLYSYANCRAASSTHGCTFLPGGTYCPEISHPLLLERKLETKKLTIPPPTSNPGATATQMVKLKTKTLSIPAWLSVLLERCPIFPLESVSTLMTTMMVEKAKEKTNYNVWSTLVSAVMKSQMAPVAAVLVVEYVLGGNGGSALERNHGDSGTQRKFGQGSLRVREAWKWNFQTASGRGACAFLLWTSVTQEMLGVCPPDSNTVAAVRSTWLFFRKDR
ncbi:hypothetical protein BDR03DRAFT_981528 [Suillus americanus]|nr:hypothetical protein BDR03DRAFT_981528 [Suillus americanus]